MDEIIKCSICLRKFEDPRVLNCQHTFCLRPCLESIYQSDLCIVRCPICSLNHAVQGDLDTVSSNVTIERLINLAKSKKDGNTCFLCMANDKSLVTCPCCEKTLCHQCGNSHLEQTKLQLEKLNATLKVNLNIEKNTYQKCVKSISEVQKKKTETIASVNNFINDLVTILQKRKADLINEVNKLFENDYKALKTLREIKEVDVVVISSSVHSIKNVLETNNVPHEEVLSLLKSLQSTVPLSLKQDISKDFEIKNVDFSYDLKNAKEIISKIGKVTYSSKTLPENGTSLNESTKQEVVIIRSISSDVIPTSPMIRNQTFIINKPSKSISYDLSVNEFISLPTKSFNEALPTKQFNLFPDSKYSSKNIPIIIFGTKGTGPGEFIWPRGIAVDNDNGKVIVADSSNHRVQIFSNIGECEKIISQVIFSTENNENCKSSFDCLSGVTIDRDNKIICSDRYNHRAIIMDEDGRLIKEIGKGINDEALLSYPWGIAVDSKSNIMICDKYNHRIQVFSSNGEYIKQIGSYGKQQGCFDNPHYLSVCPKTHNIYVSDTSNHRIQIFSKNGVFLNSFSGDGPTKFHLKYPRGINIDSEGNVLVCDSGNNRVSIFTAQGKLVHMFGSHGSNLGQFKGLEGISTFSDGRIVVTDRDNHRIQIF